MAEHTEEVSSLMGAEEFEKHVEALVFNSDDQITHLEAVVEFCESRGLEVESVASILTPSLKTKLEECYMSLHMLPKRATLPMDL